MPRRRVVAATDTASAVALLRSNDRNRVGSSTAGDDAPRVVFMFPGGGAQYNGMAAGLDERFSVFHEVMADGIERVRRRAVPTSPRCSPPTPPRTHCATPTASLPAVFLTSLALARQWMAWGVTPDALLGHSLGEYVAAHLAGVLSLDDALELVVRRSRLIGKASGAGAMLAIPLPEAEVRPLLDETLSVATVNAADECVVAGPADAIEALQQRVTTDEVSPTLIPLAGAGHSSLLDPILPEFLEVVRGVELSAAAAAVPLQPHRHVDHAGAGHRPAVLGRPPAPHGSLRRLPGHRARRRPDGARRARTRATRCRRTPAARRPSRWPPSRACATPTR